ncbi:Ig-like domain-containing protein [Streptomyces sp. NPDC018031]|uniref:L,D-transpeptidase n=1 Tax=Streptomyces sp. NPDC018031 TaxID=3365033 RepID=UPI0037B0C5FE
MRPIRPLRPARILIASALAVTALAGCQSSSGKAAASVDAADAKPAVISVTPGPDGRATAPDSTVAVTVEHGTLTDVEVTSGTSGAAPLTGTWTKGKKGWRSDRTLTPGATYTLRATATNAAGKSTTERSTVRVREATLFNGVNVTPAGNKVVGAGQPVSIAFDHPVKNKAAVERRLSVSTTPRTEGSWGWVRDPLTGVERVDWRPKTYWAKGTRVTLRAKLSGVDTGDSRYLRRDVTSTFSIGTVRVSKVDLKKHTMTVYEDGRRIRTIPISGGSPSYPTWNGTMVVLDKAPMVNMTNTSVGIADPYDKDVPWAVHLTTSGTYAHAAPWNEGKGYFGNSNQSHGCVGMSEKDGKWFYDRAVRGDLVEVTGSTRQTVPTGNGYGDWNPSYEDWKQLSALD